MKKILVTTTDSLQGWDILNYIEPIYSSVVLSTGAFSENGITWSEYFSLYPSKHYSRNVNNINQRAIEILKAKARNLGANAILALRVDVDSIGLNGVQMFMVTAWGTAVWVKNKAVPEDIGYKEFDKFELIERMHLQELIIQIKSENFQPGLKDLEIIAKSALPEFAVFMIKQYLNSESGYFNKEEKINRSEQYDRYFLSTDYDYLVAVVGDGLLNGTFSNRLTNLLELIKNYDLLSYATVKGLLMGGDLERKQFALKMLQFDKAVYSKADIVEMEQLINDLNIAYPKARIEIRTVGSRTDEYWICVCGQPNKLVHELCYNCARDIYGHKQSELKLVDIVSKLENRIKALNSLL